MCQLQCMLHGILRIYMSVYNNDDKVVSVDVEVGDDNNTVKFKFMWNL